MIANFVNLADNKFSLNGIEYHKNYAPIQVNQSDSQVRVISAYDSRFQLVPPTHYSEYTVNGVTYGSVQALIHALVDVVFSKFTLDGVAKEFQDSVLQYMDDIESDISDFKGVVNNDLQQITIEKQAFESEAQEIKDAVANMTTTGKIYDSLADAIAESPKPADGTPFSVIGDGDNDGYWKFDSTQPDGVKFGRKFDRRLQVESISQLRNYKGSPGEAVDVLGYYENGDGGGGLFYWDAASTEDDNGGTVIQGTETNGRWKRKFEGGVFLKWFGASKVDSVGNFSALVKACEVSDNVIIDDFYSIERGSTIEISGNVSIQAKKHGDGFSFLTGGTLFSVSEGGVISFKGLRLINNNENILIILSPDSAGFVERFELVECHIENRIRPINYVGSVDLDPNVVNFGVGEFIIKGNTTKNTENTFIRLAHSPTRIIEVKDNSVSNFSHTWLSAGISNGSANEELVRDKKIKCVIENNIVVNEDNWSPEVNSSYFCFALFEGINVTYKNNHVEGMRSDSDVALYDAYLSAVNVVYEGNVWRNNVCFSGGISNNFLFKSKGSGVSQNNSLGRRIYRNNTFEVTKDWLTRIGKTINETWVNWYDTVPSGDLIVRDNYISVIGILWPTSTEDINSFDFSNNIIEAEWASGGKIFNFRRENPVNKAPSRIVGNTITVFDENATGSRYDFFGTTASNYFDAVVTIKGNTITTLGETLGNFLSGVNAEELQITDNVIRSSINSFLIDVKAGVIFSKNNNIESERSGGDRFINWNSSFASEMAEFELSSFNITDPSRVIIPIYADNDLEKTLFYNISYKVIYGGSYKLITAKYKVYKDASGLHISFKDENGNDVDFILFSGNGNGVDMLGVQEGDADVNLFFRLYDANPKPFFRIWGTPEGKVRKEVKIEVVPE